MELEHSTAAGLSVLLRSRAGGSVAARGGWGEATAAGPGQTTPSPAHPSSSSSTTLSTEVREMLAAQRRNDASKRAQGPCHSPGPGNSAGADSQGSCATMTEVAPAVLPTARTRQALAKRVARRMLRRWGASPPLPADHNGTKVVLTCCCERLPPGLCCALHQRGDAPGRPWTRDGAGGRTRGWAFSEYAWWRRSVWVPSRFYLERAGVGQGDRASPGPALLVERTARCAGFSVRRFLLVGGGDPEQSVSGM